MNKLLVFTCACALAGFLACSNGAKAEIKTNMVVTTKLCNTTMDKLNKAKTGKEAADVLIAFWPEHEKLTQQMKALHTKNPEILTKIIQNPDEYKTVYGPYENALNTIQTVIFNAEQKFKGSKELQDAYDTYYKMKDLKK